jgi:chromosome segregation ATPase
MQKKDMSERIKFVSKELGLKFEPGADRHTKKSVHQIKDEHHKKAQEQEKLRLKEQYNFKQYQKQITALTELNSDQKKELHRLNTAVSKGKAEFEELKNKIKADNHDNHVVLTLSTALERVKSKDLTITELKNDLNKLSEAFLERGVTITSQKESLELLESNMSVLRAENERGHEIYQEQQEEIYQLKQSNSSLQSEYSSLKQTSEATEERAEKAESKVVELEAEVKKWTSIFKSKDDELAKANQKIVELSQPKHPKVEEAAIYATAVLEQINKNPNLEFEEVMVDLYSKLSTTIQQEQQQQVKSQSQGITR